LELSVVLAIMGFLAMIMSPVLSTDLDQERYEKTLRQMEEIRKALVGGPSSYLNGQPQFAGYAYDLGGLPSLVDVLGTPGDSDDDQPQALWQQGTLPDWQYDSAARIRAGWRGPYIEVPTGGVLRDGWGNPLVFTLSEGDLTVASCGADGTPDTGSEAGYDEDITFSIQEEEYLAPLAGRVVGFPAGKEGDIRVQIAVASAEGVDWLVMDKGVPADGYFRFEPRDSATEPETESSGSGRKYAAVPAGIRSIYAYDTGAPPSSPAPLVLSLEASGNWIGEIAVQ
jgi:type II secretory pathway pseudopilin PulG